MSLVLIAEDSASVRLLLVRRLEMAGHEVVEAHQGQEAIAVVSGESGGETPDIVLLDAMMPDTNGPEVLNEIKRMRPELPVLVVSGMPNLTLDPEWQAADGRLSKPIDFEDLLGRIESLTA